MSPEREFAVCNADLNLAFMLSGDLSNSALLLPELVNDGVRLLVYAGNAGMFFSPAVFCISLSLSERRWSCAVPSMRAGLGGAGLSSSV